MKTEKPQPDHLYMVVSNSVYHNFNVGELVTPTYTDSTFTLFDVTESCSTPISTWVFTNGDYEQYLPLKDIVLIGKI